MEFYGHKSRDLPRFAYRNFLDQLQDSSTNASIRPQLVENFCNYITTLQPSGDWLRMKWCVPPELKAVLTAEEFQKVDAALAEKRRRRNEKFLEAYPHCSDEYSTEHTFLDAAFGSKKYPLLDRKTKIFTMGSCFALNIAHYLGKKGYDITPYVQVEDLNSPFSNAKMLEVCVAPEAKRKAYIEHWLKRFYPEHKKINELVAKEMERLDKLRELITNCEFMVVTCGNVLDYFLKEPDSAFSFGSNVAPKFLSVSFKEDVTVRANLTQTMKDAGSEFRLGTYKEVVAAMDSLYQAIRSINPNTHLLLTLSPIPIDSALGINQDTKRGAIEIDCISKSLLRVALYELLEQKTKTDAKLMYFPSFEVIRWVAPNKDAAVFGKEDANSRHISQDVLSGIYDYFIYKFGKEADSQMAEPQQPVVDEKAHVAAKAPKRRKRWAFFKKLLRA